MPFLKRIPTRSLTSRLKQISIAMSITVRRFAADEWRVYRGLRLRALLDSPDSFGSTHEREVTRSDEEWDVRLRAAADSESEMPVVALDGETPVGLAWGRRDEGEPTIAYVHQVWVEPAHRGQGVGALLTAVLIAWGRELGVSVLRLGVTPSHPAARALYQRAGFRDVGEPEPLRPGSSVLSQQMQLVLASARSDRSG